MANRTRPNVRTSERDEPSEATPEVPVVQLLHAPPGEPPHVDLMIATDPEGTGPLRTWRLPGPLRQGGDAMPAEPLPDHRPRYLDYEGPISGDRGTVRRLARGTARVTERPGGTLELHFTWHEHARDLPAPAAAAHLAAGTIHPAP